MQRYMKQLNPLFHFCYHFLFLLIESRWFVFFSLSRWHSFWSKALLNFIANFQRRFTCHVSSPRQHDFHRERFRLSWLFSDSNNIWRIMIHWLITKPLPLIYLYQVYKILSDLFKPTHTWRNLLFAIFRFLQWTEIIFRLMRN